MSSQNKVTSDYDSKRKQEYQRNWVAGILSEAQSRKFYGRIVLIIEGGVIQRVIKEESLKLPDIP